MPTLSSYGEGNIAGVATGKTPAGAAESGNLSMPQNSNRENREIPSVSESTFDWERSANVSDGKADMHADGKSHDFVVLSTRANKAATAVAESVKERESPKGSIVAQPWTYRTQRRSLRQLHGTAITTGSETKFRDRGPDGGTV